MASISIVSQRVGGGSKETVADVTLDSSYPSSGEVFTADDVDMQSIEYGHAQIQSVSASTNFTSAYVAPSATGFNLWAFNETPAQVTATNSLDANVVRLYLYGR